MKYKVGDKVKIINHNYTGVITNIVDKKEKYRYVVQDKDNIYYCEEDTFVLYCRDNRQWLERLSNKEYAKEIGRQFDLWHSLRTETEFEEYLEKWLQAEHEE